MSGVVIVGAGHGGVDLAFGLRERGFEGSVTLLDKSGFMPYERPPMSKSWINGDAGPQELSLRSPDVFAKANIDLRLNCEVLAINREHKLLETSGGALEYSTLVLALGSSPRQLPIPGASRTGIYQLHTLEHATVLRERLATATKVGVIGAGFIGLEFASSAAKRGLPVTVMETAGRLMPRTASETTSRYFQVKHEEMGTKFCFNAAVQSAGGANEAVEYLALADGSRIGVDLVVQGIGANANGQWVQDIGLDFDNGIMVDSSLRTKDQSIYAIGDCARFRDEEGVGVRLESIGNAADHARRVAASIAATPAAKPDVPWFWTQQAGARLQMAGRIDRVQEWLLMGAVDSGAFSVLGWRDQQLVYGESINSAGDHVAIRKLLAATSSPTLADLRPVAEMGLKAALKSLMTA